MVIKAQNGQLHAAKLCMTYVVEESYGLMYKLIGLTHKNTEIEPLKYPSFKKIIHAAKKHLEHGIANGQRLVDLTGICGLDYISAEL